MKIIITGDVSTCNIDQFNINNLSEDFIRLIKNSDFVIFNLEGPIFPKGMRTRLRYRSNIFLHYMLNYGIKIVGKEQPLVISDEHILNLLSINKNTIVTLANNHIKDGGKKALEYTIALLQQKNIKYVGAGYNNNEALQPLVITHEHGGVVLLNLNWVSSRKYRFQIRLYNATVSDYGSAYLDTNYLKKMVAQLRLKFRHVIIVLHHGKMITQNNNDPGIEYEELASLDAAAVIIHHPHVYVKNPYEHKNVVLVGDFLFSDPVHLSDKDRLSSLAAITISGDYFNLDIEEFCVNEVYAYNNNK